MSSKAITNLARVDERAAAAISRGAPAERPAAPAGSRRRLLAAARRILWSLVRGRARGPRCALRELLRLFLKGAGQARLLRLLRDAAFAAAVAAALLATASPASAQGIDLADVAAGRGGFVVEGKGRPPSGIGWSVANAGDVNGDGIPDAIVAGRYCYYGCYTVPVYVVFGRADGGTIDLEDHDGLGVGEASVSMGASSEAFVVER